MRDQRSRFFFVAHASACCVEIHLDISCGAGPLTRARPPGRASFRGAGNLPASHLYRFRTFVDPDFIAPATRAALRTRSPSASR
jgi:hypothetical protein